MGPSTATIAAAETIQLCLFDLRRGHHEGQELDKILFFFLADLPFSKQLSVIGLSEGLITFTRIFSPEAACEVIEADRHSHVFYEAEPDNWMVVEKSKDAETIWRIDALQKVLKEVHSLFIMFHGSIRSLLEKEPGGELARSHLYTFIMDYLSDFLVGKKLLLPSFRDYLKERGTVQMLTVGREAAMEVQESLVALSKLREEVDLEKSRSKWDNAGHEKDLEICIRAKNNVWVIARVTRGKELYMVLEKANETLLYASDMIEKFSNRYCNGAFSLG